MGLDLESNLDQWNELREKAWGSDNVREVIKRQGLIKALDNSLDNSLAVPGTARGVLSENQQHLNGLSRKDSLLRNIRSVNDL